MLLYINVEVPLYIYEIKNVLQKLQLTFGFGSHKYNELVGVTTSYFMTLRALSLMSKKT